jgi:enoyl-CoA hydratase/carnithine racemase
MSDVVLTEQRGRVLLITMNRPDAMNAIDSELGKGILDAVRRLDDDPDLTAGVLTGGSRAFCSGMDLKAFAKSGPPKGLPEFLQSGSAKPLIAAIEGLALAGGLELALTCDLLVAARGAKLGVPEVKVGLFAAGGALLRLPQRVPYGVALEMAITAEPITAEQAATYGLVNRLTDVGKAVDVALELAESVARNAPLAVTASKELMRDSLGCSEAEFWQRQQATMSKVFRSNDAKEGPRAFAEKRAPNWSGT